MLYYYLYNTGVLNDRFVVGNPGCNIYYLKNVDWTYTGPYYDNHPYIPCPNHKTLMCGKAQDETPICDKVVTSVTPTNPVQMVSRGENIVSTASAIYLDGHTGTVNCSISGYDKDIVGNQIATLTYSGLVDNAKTTGTKTCIVNVTVKDNKKLTQIVATPGTQIIKRYENPTLNVLASYSDGSSKTITGYTVTGFSNSVLGTQSATVSYAENGITKTATLQITVTKLITTCPVCNAVYELDENDVDNGCPVCNGTIVGITASPTDITVNKGDSLNITVTATYKNGKTNTITGWTSDYNKDLIGLQSVKITYGLFETYVTVMINNNTKICPVCGTEYELNEDGSDPGCPICNAEVVSISASPKDISIGINDALKLTVTATYRDGHTSVVIEWYTNFTPDTTGT
jgi:Zn finger protein HypA/HybF involved in hydrogenase expression